MVSTNGDLRKRVSIREIEEERCIKEEQGLLVEEGYSRLKTKNNG